MNRCLHAVAVLGVADVLAHGPRHVDELAALTGAHAPSLYRILRTLASKGVFTEVEPKSFDLTPPAEVLVSARPGGSAREAFIGSRHRWAAWNEIVHAARTGEPAFEKAHGMSFFEWLRLDPEGNAWFNRNMQSSNTGFGAVEAYDFSPMDTVVDVGGGTGSLLSALLRSRTGLRGVLLDLPHVVEEARTVLEAAGVAGRCEVVAGDFFESVPGGADGYVLARVLHDWDDDRAVTILSAVREAVPSHGRLVVVEMVLAPGDQPDMGKLVDIVMMVMTGGRERSEEEFSALFARAGFRLSRVIETTTRHRVLEGLPV